MKINHNERGVAPVIAVVLMLAITVLLVGAAATFLLDTGNQLQDPAPNLAMEVEENEDFAVVRSKASSSANESVTIKVNGQEEKVWKDFSAGEETALACLKPGDTIQVVSGDSTSQNIIATHDIQQKTGCNFKVTQDGSEFIATPVNWQDASTEASKFYSYGGDDGTGHPHTHMDDAFQQSDTTYMFFYEYNEEVSLVIVHDRADEHNGHGSLPYISDPYGEDTGGGEVYMTFYNLPEGGDWSVRDDDPGNDDYDCNTPADASQRVCWYWGTAHTDGGVYSGGFSGDISDSEVVVKPDMRSGIDSLEFVYGTESSPETTTLDMTKNISFSKVENDDLSA